MVKILVTYHSQTGNTAALAKAVGEGASSVSGTKVVVKKALEATLEDLLNCDGIAIGTPDYFSYMAGGLKDFFDRTYYPSQGKVTGKPYVAFVSHGGGGSAINSVEKTCKTFKLKKAAEPLSVKGKPSPESFKKAQELGKALVEAIK